MVAARQGAPVTRGHSDARSARPTTSRPRIPLALEILLHTGTVIVVGSTWLSAVDRFSIHAIMTGAMAGAISTSSTSSTTWTTASLARPSAAG